MADFTQDDLLRILRQVAGESAEIAGTEKIDEVSFPDLGYDSLALLEVAASIEREYGVRLADDTFLSAETPQQLVDLVNASLAVTR
ncbi:acyl carrier protein [Streptomonospora sp. PA3]|uniref:acyl carrier protein n=1 Tax=Streptomonospora sp. PA3 TaxID=2607326 RepID=UPI0012DCB27F|nr:acyl carrier protein [Streptomonospora sp. PA3]MUL41480.1 acyl carrier protein [Streptomonospora sp. PA3]